jgi:dienelactone hydrolase
MPSKYTLLFLLLGFSMTSVAQKPPLDSIAFKKWTSVGSGDISPDGNYIYYTFNDQSSTINTLVILSTKSDWERRFQADGYMAHFTKDNRHFIFKLGIDTLCILELGGKDIEFIPKVSGYKLSEMQHDIWLAYQLTAPANELVLRTLVKRREQHFFSVGGYIFSDSSKYLLLYTESKEDSVSQCALKLICLDDISEKVIWSGFKKVATPGNYTFDDAYNQLAFIVERKDSIELSYRLWYYLKGMDTAIILAHDQTLGIGQGLQIANSIPEFSNEGRKIFLKLQTIKKKDTKPGTVKVDIWSYTDPTLQSVQLDELKYTTTYTSVIDIADRAVIRLEQENEQIVSHHGNMALVRHEMGNKGSYESHWNIAAQLAFYLVSVKDGSRKLLKNHILNYNEALELSPDGKWIVYYDINLKNYFSYQLATGITRNITKGISAFWTKSDNDWPEPILMRGIEWLPRDEAMLIRDNFDIWQIDLEGIRKPLNLTNGYGRKHLITFQVFNTEPSIYTCTDRKSFLIISAFNTVTKDRGFYRATLGVSVDPELCSMGPYVYGEWSGHSGPNYPPIKAAKSDSYLVLRMNAKEAPNYFITKDFKKFTPLSNVQPQKAYNWITTELIHWKTLGGNINSGILYKPEDFDPSKRYPVIFDIYEIRSDELNLYIRPKASEDRINIPWFVSNGYLVCTPDIHYKIGEPGLSVYNSVVSAAGYLSKMPWVDAQRMGIQGHSFGGYETNYIVTHTHLFAAACAASGASDLISMYGSVSIGGYHKYHEERQQGRMGATLWQVPGLYIRNSPIFNADKVTTPLLLLNNKEDISVPFTQGVEFFTALRRLGKKVWMLQYDGSKHSVFPEMAIDYHIRMVQFFDHYLKKMPAPRWMTRGIPAVLKGIDDGLDLDDKIKTPGDGLNIKKLD